MARTAVQQEMMRQEIEEVRRARIEAQASAREIETLLDCIRRSPADWWRLDLGRRDVQPDLFGPA